MFHLLYKPYIKAEKEKSLFFFTFQIINAFKISIITSAITNLMFAGVKHLAGSFYIICMYFILKGNVIVKNVIY